MDFLDPKRKRAHRRRLFVGYVLMAIAISMGTLILLFTAYGYDVDRKTGEVIRNGTFYMASKPSGAKIDVDGKRQSSDTSTRLDLPGGKQYNLVLSKDGYKKWIRLVALESGTIEHVIYPILIPETIKQTELQLYASAPALASQSKDFKKLLVQQPGQQSVFDLYDLQNPTSSSKVLAIPNSAITSPNMNGTMEVVEWSSDSKHVMLKRTYDNKVDYILLDTEDAAKSKNVNATFSVTPTKVQMIDGKTDSLYIQQADGSLRRAVLDGSVLSEPVLSGVITFDSIGKDIILYATPSSAPENSVSFRIRTNDELTYLLKTVPVSTSYTAAIEEYDNTPYFVVGGNAVDAVFVYRNPIDAVKGQKNTPVLVNAVMRGKNVSSVAFAPKAHRYISAQSEQGMVVYDIENDRQFTFKPVAGAQLSWMSEYQFSYNDQNSLFMIDFDGSNAQKLADVNSGMIGYLAPNFERAFSLSPSPTVSGRSTLLQSDLIVR